MDNNNFNGQIPTDDYSVKQQPYADGQQYNPPPQQPYAGGQQYNQPPPPPYMGRAPQGQLPIYWQYQQPMVVPASQPGDGMAVAAFVLGMAGLVFCQILIPSIIATILAVMARKRGLSSNKSGLATAGLVLGIIGIVIVSLIILMFLFIFLIASPSYPYWY